MIDKKKTINLPKINWKSSVCEVCGETFDYMSKKRPKVCKKGECQYKYHYNIDRHSWAGHQFSLFEK